MARHDPRSVLTRPARPPDLTVRYGPLAEQIADVWTPAGAAHRPAVMFLHGGFWRAEYDRVHVAPLCADLAARGWVAIAPEYRRTGSDGGGWPGTFADVHAAAQTVPALVARELGTATDFVLAGHSAGGQLALWVGSQRSPRDAAAALSAPGDAAAIFASSGEVAGLRGVLALAPVADLVAAAELDLDGGAARLLMGGLPAERPAQYAAANPMALSPRVPVTVLHGTDDRQVPVDFSRAYAARIGGRYHELTGVEHFGLIDPLSSAWPRVIAVLEELASG